MDIRQFTKSLAAMAATISLGSGMLAQRWVGPPALHTPKAVTDSKIIYVALYKWDPSEGEYTEADYRSYERVAIPRDGEHWEITGSAENLDAAATNKQDIIFPRCTGNGQKIDIVAICDESGKELFMSPLNVSIHIDSGTQPLFYPGDLTITTT